MARKPFAKQLGRVRKLCLGLPDSSEKLSHGEPTFFVRKRVFAAFSNNHHNDGHVAVLLPAPPGLQEVLIEEAPDVYYRPPYVGGAGWIGVELDRVSDDALEGHIREAWNLIVSKEKKKRRTAVKFAARIALLVLLLPGMAFGQAGFRLSSPDIAAGATIKAEQVFNSFGCINGSKLASATFTGVFGR